MKLADDADEVLAKCRSLRDSLRKKQLDASHGNFDIDVDDSDGEWGVDDDDDLPDGNGKKGSKRVVNTNESSKTQRVRLCDLKGTRSLASASSSADGKFIVEVVEMNSTEVMEGIENVAVNIAKQVLAKQVRIWTL